jgi:pseudouridine-5'-phosphate glycosidase
MKWVWSAEVRRAQRAKKPLVALESSVLAQGLPFPQNVEAARRCETAIRQAGAVPATIALIEGQIHVGLTEPQVRLLSTTPGLLKIGSRDLAMAIALGKSGGTTVSATCEIAAKAGLWVFATGGLGGVHRGVAEALDISQDVPALARWPVAVVCAGAKSVLDLPKTLELLETFGVPVIGFQTGDLPGFYSRSTGLALEHRVESTTQAAKVVLARRALRQGGVVFAVPPPVSTALGRSEVERHLRGALGLAKKRRVRGKDVTPFLLQEMVRRTKGRTLVANLALLENNARFAGEMAVELKRCGAFE